MSNILASLFQSPNSDTLHPKTQKHFEPIDMSHARGLGDYLQSGIQSVFAKYQNYAGLRNLSNTCYLNVALQLVYNIPVLRQILLEQSQENTLLQQMQKVLALVHAGTLAYVDTQGLFAVLQGEYPQVFVSGAQGDFMEIYQILLERIEKGVREQKKAQFKKMFYGRAKIDLLDDRGHKISHSDNQKDQVFSILNIPVSNCNLQNGLCKLKKETIEGFMNSKGEQITVTKHFTFVETPIYLNFVINRISYENGKLVKNMEVFDYEEQFALTNDFGLSKIYQQSDIKFTKEYEKLSENTQSFKKAKQHLIGSISYLQAKNKINVNENLENTICQLKNQISEIDYRISKNQQKMKQIDQRKKQVIEHNKLEMYHIWGVMIHCGQRVDSGHYKVCLKVKVSNKQQWMQFNDRKVQLISKQKIQDYKKKGEICGIFYRKGNQIHEEINMTRSLINYVETKQRQIIKKIDEINISEFLNEEIMSLNLTWPYKKTQLQKKPQVFTYFFKPILHLILEDATDDVCKQFLLYESIKDPCYIQSIKDRLINQKVEFEIPKINFNIPKEYDQFSEIARSFLTQEINNPIQAYDLLSCYSAFKSKNVFLDTKISHFKEIAVLKGTFYESMFVEYNFLEMYATFSRSMDQIIASFPPKISIVKKLAEVRKVIRQRYDEKNLTGHFDLNAIFINKHTEKKETGHLYFEKRFHLWILFSYDIAKFDKSVLEKYKKLYHSYVTIVD